MKVYLFGFRGNMAQRYRAILRHLGHTAIGEDLGWKMGSRMEADAFIVATPTATHVDILESLKTCGRPVLCEKPITKDLEELDLLLWSLRNAGTKLSMVSQYDYLLDESDKAAAGLTVYDYFRHGQDGLAWDCINVLKHAKGDVVLLEESPVWTCQINGKTLSLADMDGAYVEMIDDWLRSPPTATDFDAIFEAHRKASEWAVKLSS